VSLILGSIFSIEMNVAKTAQKYQTFPTDGKILEIAFQIT